MNFKIILVLIFLSACGVKGDPVTPKEPAFPSLLQNYPDIETDKKLEETKKR
ncbi:MAG: lipoprotein [Bdellovibrionota bacterium]